MTEPDEKWFRIRKGALVYPGRPFKAVHINEKEIGGWVELGGIRGWATAMRWFSPDQLEPMDGPPKSRPHMIRRRKW
jgi:hypothetical protein